MIRQIILVVSCFVVGLLLSLGILFYSPLFATNTPIISPIHLSSSHEVIGFLPYWLLDKASTSYAKSITTLTYFALRIDKDGSIVKLSSPTEAEPGWYALTSGKVMPFLQDAKAHQVKLSLVLDSGDVQTINAFISNPVKNANTLTQSVIPLMKQYGFSDLNLDIEYPQEASIAAQMHFTQFVKEIRHKLPSDMSLTLEVSPLDAIQKKLIDMKQIAPYLNYIVIMAYDFHAPDSFVTGPVAPLGGAGVSSEYDVATATLKTVQVVPSGKVILGIPLYGYEWETLGSVPRSAIIPGSGVLASSHRAAELLSSCASCSAQMDADAKEPYISYFNSETKTNHLLFFPEAKATQAKIMFARNMNLGGLALWALGYEDPTILQPLSSYKN